MPRMSRKAVLAKVRKIWPDENTDAIMAILDRYGDRVTKTGRARVQLGILKLCDGKLEDLEDLVKMAKVDFRDVLAYAEYPEEVRTDPTEMREMSQEAQDAIRERDKKQYKDWLKR